MDYGLSERTCEKLISEDPSDLSAEHEEEDRRLFANLLRNLNNSVCEDPSIKDGAAINTDEFLRFGNPRRSTAHAV
jgi:hypothetical protein